MYAHIYLHVVSGFTRSKLVSRMRREYPSQTFESEPGSGLKVNPKP